MDAKLDTAFNGEIGLPRSDFERLDKSSTSTRNVALADGTVASVQSCSATVRLGSDWQEASILDFGESQQPLIGMEILLGRSVYIEARPYGKIRIAPLD